MGKIKRNQFTPEMHKLLRHEFDLLFSPLQIAWMEDAIVNGLAMTHYTLDKLLSSGQADMKNVEKAYKEVQDLITKIRDLRNE